jgi:hypothetical protein
VGILSSTPTAVNTPWSGPRERKGNTVLVANHYVDEAEDYHLAFDVLVKAGYDFTE